MCCFPFSSCFLSLTYSLCRPSPSGGRNGCSVSRLISHPSGVVPVERENLFPKGFNQSPKKGSYWPSLGHRLIREPITVQEGVLFWLDGRGSFGPLGVGDWDCGLLKGQDGSLLEERMPNRQKQKCEPHPSGPWSSVIHGAPLVYLPPAEQHLLSGLGLTIAFPPPRF